MTSVTKLATRNLGGPIRPITQWLLEDGGTSPAAERPAGLDERLRRSIWMVVCCLLLTVLAFLTRPGRIIADTKLDMAINPGGFLSRALHLWDPNQLGQLQNQATGYLFPMGPFFWLGHLAALQPWVIQRLWLAAVLIAAFTGTTRVAARLGVGTPMTQIVAGLGYAMCPRGLGLLGQLSSEFLPAAMLPWILLPLITAMHGGGRVRAALRSGVAVALCSGLNASATVAVLIPPVIYLLTGRTSASRWRIGGWWLLAVMAATLWWAVPLVLLGKYGFSFLPYTESASITTAVTSLANTFRGTEDWVNYLTAHGQAWWPVGYKLTVEIPLVVLTGLVAGLGLAGLARRGLPERRFLLWTLLLGLLLITAGYVSGLDNPLAGPIRHIIDGPLAPMRNVRKFDPLIRLPIAIGLAHMLAPLRFPRLRIAVSTLTMVAVAGVALPAFTNGLSSSGDFKQIPQYWVNATRWLNQHAGNQAVLVVPGARFGEYVWGRPLDDVMEPLSTARWASRSVVPQGSVGLTRLLDAVDTRLTDGAGSPGLAQVLAQMDIRYVLVRNDLIRGDLSGAWPSRVRQALDSSGLRLVTEFWDSSHLFAGSLEANDATTAFDPFYRPLLVYQVPDAQGIATLQPASQTLRVNGAPETLLTLGDEGLLADRPVLLNSDANSIPARQSVVSDALRRRVVGFGEPRVARSPTLTAGEPATTFLAADDYLVPGWRRYLTVAAYQGIKDVTASSSASDIGGIPDQDATGYLPYAALDHDSRTAWKSGSWDGPIGQWIRVGFQHPLTTRTIKVGFVADSAIGPPVTRVAVEAAGGQIVQPVKRTDEPQVLRVPDRPTTWLRIRIAGVAYAPNPKLGSQVAISDIHVPRVSPRRTIQLPDITTPSGQDPTTVVLTRAEIPASGCMPTPPRWVCSPQLTRPVEEQFGFNHTFTAAVPRAAQVYGTATLTDPALLQEYARISADEPTVTASSSWMTAPQQLPLAAFDGDPLTTWITAPNDRNPSMTISWARPRTVHEITITRPPGAGTPTQVFVSSSPHQLGSGWIVGRKGQITFPAIRTSRMTLLFSPLQTPLQITDVTIPGVHPLTNLGPSVFALPCGKGPAIRLNGALLATRVSGTYSQFLTGKPMSFAVCGPVKVARGANGVVESDNDAFQVDTVVVDRLGSQSLAADRPTMGYDAAVSVERWNTSDRILLVGASQRSYLEVNENFNTGWQARIGSAVLQPVRVDGWKQAWLIPAGTFAEVRLQYLPDTTYRRALFGGLGALGLLLLLALLLALPETLLPLPPPPPIAYGPRSLVARLFWTLSFSVAVGLWIGGYPGVIVLPIATVCFLVALGRGPTSRRARQLSRPWLVCALMVTASACAAVGQHLRMAEYEGPALSLLWSAIPQTLCMIIVARLLADLAWGALPRDGRLGSRVAEVRHELPTPVSKSDYT